jgi:hypothetical protein
VLEAKFIRNPEAEEYDFTKLNLGKLEKELDIEFIPPVLSRRCTETGISPEQYILQAFLKGKMYDMIYRASVKEGDPLIRQLDFVVTANTEVNRMLGEIEKENGTVDYKEAQKEMEKLVADLMKEDIRKRALRASSSGSSPSKASPKKSASKKAMISAEEREGSIEEA